jgi:hypothetical protein
MMRHGFRKAFGTLRATATRKAAADPAAAAAMSDSVSVYQNALRVNIIEGFFARQVKVKLPFVIAGAYSMVALMQAWYGTQDNPNQPVFEGSFKTKKNPAALAEFYQAEELLHIIAVHPIFFRLFMDKVDVDPNEMTEDTALLKHEEAVGSEGPGAETHLSVKFLGMEVSFEVIQQEEEIDGEDVVTSFCRHERFIDWVPILSEFGKKILLWDQTWKFEFNRLEDGDYEVRHVCTRFLGPFPIRIIIWFHQRYVLWACEKYINGTDFGDEEADMDKQQAIMANIPAHAVNEFISTLAAEKAKKVDAMRNDRMAEYQKLEEAERELKALRKWMYNPASDMKLLKRNVSTPGAVGAKQSNTQLVVGDKQAQEAVAVAMRDAKSNKAISSALQDLEKKSEEFAAKGEVPIWKRDLGRMAA